MRKHFIWEWARGANRSGLPVDVAQQVRRRGHGLRTGACRLRSEGWVLGAGCWVLGTGDWELWTEVASSDSCECNRGAEGEGSGCGANCTWCLACCST